jgi:DNA-binding MarR family transcriptional regulator
MWRSVAESPPSSARRGFASEFESMVMADQKDYLELTFLIERLHRRFLDVLKVEMTRLGYRDINAVQGLLLANIGEEEALVKDLVERRYYQGSNISYNIRKLVDYGYLEQERAEHDKRSVRVVLTERGSALVANIREMEGRHRERLLKGTEEENLKQVIHILRDLERLWSDHVTYPNAAE